MNHIKLPHAGRNFVVIHCKLPFSGLNVNFSHLHASHFAGTLMQSDLLNMLKTSQACILKNLCICSFCHNYILLDIFFNTVFSPGCLCPCSRTFSFASGRPKSNYSQQTRVNVCLTCDILMLMEKSMLSWASTMALNSVALFVLLFRKRVRVLKVYYFLCKSSELMLNILLLLF